MDDNRTIGFDEAQGTGPDAGQASPSAEDRGTRQDITRDVPSHSRVTAADGDVRARVEAAVAATGHPDDETRPAQPVVDPMLGAVVSGRFEVLSRLGAGGMGIVYRARQIGMDRHVAIKMLLKELAGDEQVVKRFKIEALAVSRLNHPNTIRIFDFGQTDDGNLYFAMEFLEGRPLERAVRKEGPFPAARVLHVVKQIAASLAEAHEKGIVHRDLKPDNVYLTVVGNDSDFVKVLDFGVAKLREADKRQGTVTQAGMIFGTPRYMAPEQCRSQPVDARADVYALGIMAYEMLTGHTPFDAENPLAILIQHVQEMPKPFAEARPDLEIPPEVEALVMRCLEKSADARFQSANDLSLEISRVEAKLAGTYRQVVLVPEERRAGRAEAARSQTRTSIGIPEATPYRRKRRWVVPAVAVVLVAGGLGAWAALGPTGDAAVEPPAPVAASTTPVAPPPVQPPVATKVEPSPVTMRFTSDPEGAEVVWNDRILGKTPFQKDLVPADGPGRFLFRRAGFRDATVEAAVAAGAEVAAVMKRVGAATGPAPVKGVPAGPTPTPTPTPKKDDSPSRVGDLKKMEY